MLSQSKLLAVGLLLAVGATGFVSGHATAGYRAGRCEGHRERGAYLGMLQDSLGLTDAQRDTVHAILVRHRPEFDALITPIRPKVDSLRQHVNDEIAATLTASQREHFAALRDRWRLERIRHDSATADQGRR